MAARLAEAGIEALHDVVLAGPSGPTQIDHIARGDGAIAVLETKTWSGTIVGTPEAAEWHQLLRDGEVRTPLPNAARQNGVHCAAVLAVLDAVGCAAPVVGLLVNAGQAQFSAPLDRLVLELEEVAAACRDAGPRPVAVEAGLSDAWEAVVRAAGAGEALRDAQREAAEQRRRVAGR